MCCDTHKKQWSISLPTQRISDCSEPSGFVQQNVTVASPSRHQLRPESSPATPNPWTGFWQRQRRLHHVLCASSGLEKPLTTSV